jgi:translation elongation factor EF-4
MRSIKEAFVGDTIYMEKKKVEPFEGFKQPKPMVFFLIIGFLASYPK